MKSYDLTPLNVLIVERLPHMRSIMRSIFRELGVDKIKDTSSPETALEYFQKQEVDLVVTDWSPGLDGLELLRQLRNPEQSRDPYVPVIVVTANTELRHVVMARDLGMTEFLAKPVSPRLLYARVCSAIEQSRVFINNTSYFGPDRRRRYLEVPGEERRAGANSDQPERRQRETPFDGPERRHDKPGFMPQDLREAERA